MTGPGALGDPLPGFSVAPDAVQLFLFSASTWNPHRIHYDEVFATEVEQHPGVVVQGPLIGSWVLELATAWTNGWGAVRHVEYRNTATSTTGDRLAVGGEVTGIDEEPSARVTVTNQDGVLVCEGTITAERV